MLLMGKNKPTYLPNQNTGDYVVVVNAGQIKVTGNKLAQMKYYRHSGYPGGLRERNLEQVLEKDPTRVLHDAVRGMLPKNYLARKMLARLKLELGESADKYTSQIVGAQRAAEKAALAPVEAKPAKKKASPRKKAEEQPEAEIKLAKPRAAKAAEMKKAPAAKAKTGTKAEPKAAVEAGSKTQVKPKVKAVAKPKAIAKSKPKAKAKAQKADKNEEA